MPKAKVKINDKWYDIGGGMTLEEKKQIDDKLIELETSVTVTQGQISTKVSQAEVDVAVRDTKDYAKNYADSVTSVLGQDLSMVQGDLDNLEIYLEEAFKDGIIYEAERIKIEGYINTLGESRAVLNARYVQIYNDPLLVDNPGATPPQTSKANLLSAMVDYDIKYQKLVDTIYEVIESTRVDEEGKIRVNTAYANYRTSIGVLSTAFEKAINFIAQKKADMAEANAARYTDGLIGPLAERVSVAESTIEQTARDIQLRVIKEDYDNQVMKDNWYNFVKQGSPNIMGDLEALTPPEGYSWALADLPDGSQGRVLRKKHVGGSLLNNTQWLMPEIKVDPKKPYLMEFWVRAMDMNSQLYYGREEYKQLADGSLADNDQGVGPYMVAALKATAKNVGKWVKHYAVIPPHNAGTENDHFTPQSAYTPDMEYKFWNKDSTYIRPKVYLTFSVTDNKIDSEMHAWGFSLHEIGSKINIYKDLEYLNLEMVSAKSSITQNAEQIALRVTNQKYNADMSGINNELGTITNRVSNNESVIAQQANQIGLRVTTETFNSSIPMTIVQDSTFEKGAQFWTTNPAMDGTSSSPVDAEVVKDGWAGGNALKITGAKTVFSKNAFAVDTSRKYRIKFRAKLVQAPTTGGAMVYAGVSTYDKNGTMLTSGVGAYRYCAVSSVTLTVAEGWREFEGIITGEGDTKHTEFRPGTKYVKPVFNVNFTSGNGITEVDVCEITDVTDAQSLQAQITIQAGQISSKVEKTDFTLLSGRVSNAESTIIQQADAITQRVTKTEYDKLAVSGRNLFTDSYLKRVISNNNTNGALTRTPSSPTDIVKMTSNNVGTYFALNPVGADRTMQYTQGLPYLLSFEVRGNVTNLNYTYMTRNSAEGANSNFGNKSVTLSDTEWITVSFLKDAPFTTSTGYFLIGSTSVGADRWFEVRNVMMEQATLPGGYSPNPEEVGGRLTTAESTIKQQADQIATKVEKNGVISSINQTAESIKIGASKIDINGAVTFSSFDDYMKQVIANEGQLINTNPYFIDWSGTLPVGYNSQSMGAGSSLEKVTEVGQRGNILKYTVGAGANTYLTPASVTVYPYFQYVTVQATFKLESGTIDSAGVLFRYNATANVDHKIHFKDMVPSPTLNKWYTVTKIIKQPVNPAGFTGYSVFPMGGYSAFATITAKTIHFSEVIARPSTEQEINAYETGATVDGWRVAGKTTINGGNIETGTLSWEKAKGGMLTLGGAGNGNGQLVVLDANGDVIANFDAESGGFDSLYVGDLESPTVVSRGMRDYDYTIYVRPAWGNDDWDGSETLPFKTVQKAIDSIPDFLPYPIVITVNVFGGNIQEELVVYGKMGVATIDFRFNNIILNGSIYVGGCLGTMIAFWDLTINSSNNATYATVNVYRSTFAHFENVKVYTRSMGDMSFIANEGSNMRLYTCQAYDAKSAAVRAGHNATVIVYNCKGKGASYGLYTYMNGEIGGSGTAPGGGTSNQGTASGGHFNGSWTYDLGAATPPPPPPATERTVTLTATSADNWSALYNSWQNEGAAKQGNYGYGNRTGAWFFGASILTAIGTGKTIKSMRVWIERKTSGGVSGAVRHSIRSHTAQTKPAGNVSVSAEVGAISLAWGKSGWATIASSAYAGFASGANRGFAIYTADGSNYSVCNANMKVEIIYQ